MEQIAINILPKGAKPVCHSSQFDEGRQIMFNLFNDKTPYTLSGTETISVLVHKPDGAEVIDSVTNTSDSYVIWDVSADACELSGVCECELSIVENGIVLGSKNFTMKVEEDAYNGKTIEVRTASGKIATFNTNMVEAFKSLKTDINPVQDLHGYSKPWSGGCGKNLLNYDAWKNSGVTNGTGVWENNGVTLTATANDCFTQAPNGFPSGAIIPISEGETITLSWEETTNKNGSIYIFPNNTTTGMVRVYNWQAKKLSYTATSGVTYVTFRFGVTGSGDTIAYKNIQIEKGSQATSWEPYSNICPISGFSALNVTLADGEMQTVDTATVNFGQIVYGGKVDVTRGKVNVTHGIVDLGTLNWSAVGNMWFASLSGVKPISDTTVPNAICTQYKAVPWVSGMSGREEGIFCFRPAYNQLAVRDTSYSSASDFKTAMSGVMLCYELATPIEISTTPENLTAIVGQNNVYGDTNGDTEVEYYIEV